MSTGNFLSINFSQLFLSFNSQFLREMSLNNDTLKFGLNRTVQLVKLRTNYFNCRFDFDCTAIWLN